MKTKEDIFPLSIELSFKKLFDEYRTNLDSSNILLKERAKQIIAIAEENPILSDGIKTEVELKKITPQIDLILEDLFSSILGKNEIKVASFPFHNEFFKTSKRYDDIIANAGEDYSIKHHRNNHIKHQPYFEVVCHLIKYLDIYISQIFYLHYYNL